MKPGAVVRCRVPFEDGADSIKRLVVLSTCDEKGTICLTTTSNKFAQTRSFDSGAVYVPPNTEPSFNVPSYIQTHRIIELDIDFVISKLDSGGFDFLADSISPELFKEVIAAVLLSKAIAGKYKNRIRAEFSEWVQ